MTELKDKILEGIENTTQRGALGAAMRRGREGRATALQILDQPDKLRERVRRTKEEAIADLDALLEEFTINATKRGATIFLAKDGSAAINYIAEIARVNNAKLITKSKSLTSEEIEMNHPLEAMGYEVVETDLGERIIQIAKEKPIHLVFPAAHKTVEQIADLFSLGQSKIQPDHPAIMKFVRENLRNIFLSADIGVTGANVAIAETGTIVIETNEGNARLVSSIPKIQVVIMGMEKIVPSVENAIDMIKAHPTSATGQQLTTYVSFISGRSPLNGQQGRKLYIIILDNGRTKIRNDLDIREALYCIRCGAVHEHMPHLRSRRRSRLRLHIPRPNRHTLDGRSPRITEHRLCSVMHLMWPMPRNVPCRHRHTLLNRESEGTTKPETWPKLCEQSNDQV